MTKFYRYIYWAKFISADNKQSTGIEIHVTGDSIKEANGKATQLAEEYSQNIISKISRVELKKIIERGHDA